jgi:hypothetical protein
MQLNMTKIVLYDLYLLNGKYRFLFYAISKLFFHPLS